MGDIPLLPLRRNAVAPHVAWPSHILCSLHHAVWWQLLSTCGEASEPPSDAGVCHSRRVAVAPCRQPVHGGRFLAAPFSAIDWIIPCVPIRDGPKLQRDH